MTLEERYEKHKRNIAMLERVNIPYEVYDNSAKGETGIALPIEGSDYLLVFYMPTRDIETQTCYGFQFFKREELAKDGWK